MTVHHFTLQATPNHRQSSRTLYSLSAAGLTACSLAAMIEMISTAKKRSDLKKAFQNKSTFKKIFNTYTLRMLASIAGLVGATYCATKALTSEKSLTAPSPDINPLWMHAGTNDSPHKQARSYTETQSALEQELCKKTPDKATLQELITSINGHESVRIMEQLNHLGCALHNSDIFQAPTASSQADRKKCFDTLKLSLGKTLNRWKKINKKYPDLTLYSAFEHPLSYFACNTRTNRPYTAGIIQHHLPKQIQELADALIHIASQNY